MKTYEIELRRTSFITLTIEAEDQDAAETLAWEQIKEDHCIDDADWEIGFVDELENIATDETRSYGPQGEPA
jgi:hypothetical protein